MRFSCWRSISPSILSTVCWIRACVMSEREHFSPNQRAWRRFRRNRGASVALVLLLGVVALILLWPLFSSSKFGSILPVAMTHDPDTISDSQFAPPGWTHWFGTDVHGRDLLSRVFYGARISLFVG